jgi:pimeloyl-ACP methyl ester carboxylesterase
MKLKTLAVAALFAVATAACATHPGTSPTVQRDLVARGDVQIETLSQGKGPAIVILPSLGRGAEDYDSVALRLEADGFRVLRPQPRGIGRSKGPMHDLDMHAFAADIAAVLDHEKTGPVVIVGHAWGSQPARMLAVDRPDLVSGLVMAAASAGKLPPGSTEKPYGRLREAIDGSGNPALPESQRLIYLQQAFFAPGHDPKPWLKGWYPATHDAQAHARNVTPVDAYFSGGSVPILDLQAQHDAVVVPNVFKQMLGDRVTVKVIPDCGHAMAPEQPGAMSEAIAGFARRIYSGNQQGGAE